MRDNPSRAGDTNVSRRSVSIFSRRGTDTPSTTLPSLVRAAVTAAQPSTTSSLGWKARRRSAPVSRSIVPDRREAANGTALNAVPATEPRPMASLEEEMATSPNDEILSAVSKDLPEHAASNFRTSQTSPSTTRDTECQIMNETKSRIGVWVNGVAQWDESFLNQANRNSESHLMERPDLANVVPSLRSKSDGTHETSALLQSRPWVGSGGSSGMDTNLTSAPAVPPKDARHSLRSLQTSDSSSYSSILDGEDTDSSKRSSATSIEPSPPINRKSSKRLSGRVLSRNTNQGRDGDRCLLSPVNISKSLPPEPLALGTRNSPLLHDPVPRTVYPTSSSSYLKQTEEEQIGGLSEQGATTAEDHENSHAQLDGTLAAPVEHRDSDEAALQPLQHAPTLPRRSRKREWRNPAQRPPQPKTSLQQPSRRRSESELSPKSVDVEQKVLINEPDLLRRKSASKPSNGLRTHDFTQLIPMSDEKIVVEPDYMASGFEMFDTPSGKDNSGIATTLPSRGSMLAADRVDIVDDSGLLRILSSLGSFEDLVNTAQINKGMYRVYKANENELIRTTTWNQSPALWECLEWSKAIENSDTTPYKYMQERTSSTDVVESLKSLIFERCQTYIRPETAVAFSEPKCSSSQRFDDALWRIWCFCRIFGCGKSREDDLTGQLDWLKGGPLANNQGCVATVNSNLDFDMSSVLLNAPEHFARGNEGGLDAEQLYDMTEIWSCLAMLLEGYLGRTSNARENGVFGNCDVNEGDSGREEYLLEEWVCHILTMGLDVVFALAEHANDSIEKGFQFAHERGWTDWTPQQYTGSRISFFKEPVARLYEERISASPRLLSSPPQGRRQSGQKRVAYLAAEMRFRRQRGSYCGPSPVESNTGRSTGSHARRDSTFDATRSPSEISDSKYGFASPILHSPISALSGPHSSVGSQWSHRRISPIIEDRVDAFNRMSLQNFAGLADSTSVHAVNKVIEMGFTPAQAQEALKKTDMGDGLRVDRAVDWLLRR
ncbi:hypothetical protein D0869_11282 [Hortaea werneckii]|uniref:UBA domain-containing protein n=1 Tax=Hortaea werneckii TaxID=91943 RepID=A0A3M7B0N3_HORWE|nr:hypothetical protein KC334_g4624 [Hortaea werneckii]KAI6950741.1 hypothetical protein KC355_g14333 [Hortaea werneckii]KAI7193815.1 hypothetical protein KC324_g5061 [Hortaea werneckii]KAI7588817.1 hypothetical protein KC316_g4280 [Hortaea werneckii]KAI7671526.1 hypothetical protein KC318_g3438 [Hortaea werneckii]